MTHLGYVKRLTSNTYRQQNRGGVGVKGITARNEDFVERILVTSTHDWLYFFTDMGRLHRLKCWQITRGQPHSKGHGDSKPSCSLRAGEKITTLIPFPQDMDIEGQVPRSCNAKRNHQEDPAGRIPEPAKCGPQGGEPRRRRQAHIGSPHRRHFGHLYGNTRRHGHTLRRRRCAPNAPRGDRRPRH